MLATSPPTCILKVVKRFRLDSLAFYELAFLTVNIIHQPASLVQPTLQINLVSTVS